MPKIEFNDEECIGCGACSSVCENWVLEADKAEPKKTKISKEELSENKEAAEACPVNCIKIVD